MNRPTVILAGTGHRPQKFHAHGFPVRGLFMLLADVATDHLTANRPDVVISGMALGWDQALAWAALRLKIPTFAYVPCKDQDSRWTVKQREFYRKLLAKCNGVKFISMMRYTPTCMEHRNRAMVNNATGILAVWDGSPGGTGNCVRYAGKAGRPVTNLWEKLMEVKP